MLCCLTELLLEWKLFIGLFIGQGILGIILFEWAWKKAERVRADTSEEALH